MGLDNGIMLRVKVDTIVPSDVFVSKYDITRDTDDFEVRLDCIPAGGYKVEICYWRKCWALRNEILKVLDAPYMGGCAYSIKNEQLDEIIEIIKKYTYKEYYDAAANGGGYGGMLWEYEDIIDSLQRQLRALEWCKKLMETQDIELDFYDSY